MTRKQPRNIAASVHQRLLNIAKQIDRPFDEVLTYFAIERLLYRLCRTKHADAFVLKGALLFRVWNTPDSRATRDVDFLGYISSRPEDVTAIFREVCVTNVEADGLDFDANSVKSVPIKEDTDQHGIRVRLVATLGRARAHLQVDIGFGDRVYPEAVRHEYPSLLDYPVPILRAYSRETVIAEKVHAMTILGSLNSRMKDFYDVWRLSQQFDFRGEILCGALRQTFSNRHTVVPTFADVVADLFRNDQLDAQWSAFLEKSRIDGPWSFAYVVECISAFLNPVFVSAAESIPFDQEWKPPGPWRRPKADESS